MWKEKANSETPALDLFSTNLTQEAKDSKLGKAVLGDDGKFDKEDVERLTEGAKEAVKDVVDKAKELFNK